MNPLRKEGLRRTRALHNEAWCRYLGLALAAKTVATFGEGTLTPYLAGAYEYESNPFYEWSGTPATVASSSDTLFRTRAGLDAHYSWSREILDVSAELRRIDYHQYSYLSHSEQTFNGKFQIGITSLVTATAEYRHEHRMVPFDELPAGTRELFLETEDLGSASVGVQTMGGWSFETRVGARSLDSPRPDVPNLDLRESSIHESIRRMFSQLALGLDGEYLAGSYTGGGELGSPSYHQGTVQLAGEHRTPGLSSFEGAIGYTHRSQTNGGSVSEITGKLGYKREFSGKTSAEFLLTRVVNSYLTTTGSEVDSVAAVKMTWQATTRIEVVPVFSLTYSDFPGQSFGSGSARRDRYEAVTLDIRYQVLDWLSLRPYGRYDVRSSNVPSYGFNASAIGLELLIQEAE
jgi:hypothetical protein